MGGVRDQFCLVCIERTDREEAGKPLTIHHRDLSDRVFGEGGIVHDIETRRHTVHFKEICVRAAKVKFVIVEQHCVEPRHGQGHLQYIIFGKRVGCRIDRTSVKFQEFFL